MNHSGLYCRAMASLYHLVTDLQSNCQPGQTQTQDRQEHTDMKEKRETLEYLKMRGENLGRIDIRNIAVERIETLNFSQNGNQ